MNHIHAVGAAIILGWDRAVDPGTCQRSYSPGCLAWSADGPLGWPIRTTRRGLDCSHGLQLATYQSRANLRRPLGPAERHHWARRRTLDRRAARTVSQLIREGRGYPIGWGEPW